MSFRIGLVVVCASIAVSCSKSKKDGEGGEGAEAKVEVSCAELPGAIRRGLQKSVKGDGFLWVEGAEQDARLVRYAGGKTTEIAKSVSPIYRQTTSGAIVFLRPTKKKEYLEGWDHQLVVVKPDGTETALTGDKLTVSNFELDSKGEVAYFAGGTSSLASKTFSVPIAGGEPTEIGGGAFLALDEKRGRILVNQVGFLGWMKLAGGEPEMVKTGGRLVSLQGDVLIRTKPEIPGMPADDGFQVTSLAEGGGAAAAKTADVDKDKSDGDGDNTKPATRPVTADALPSARWRFHASPNAGVFSGVDGDHQTVVITEGGTIARQLSVEGAEIAGAVVDGDTLTVLALQDSDGDGTPRSSVDESDLCVIEGSSEKAVELPARSVPKARVAEVAKIEAALAKAGIKPRRLRWDGELFVVYAEGDGPAELSALAKLAEAARTAADGAVAKESMVTVQFPASGRVARSEWDDKTKRSFTYSGVGRALRANRADFPLAVEPKITTFATTDYSGKRSKFGKAECSGTVTNISGEVLENIEVECVNIARFVKGSNKGEGKLSSKKLKPEAEATYKVKIPLAGFDGQFTETFRSGDRVLPYFNAFGDRKASERLELNAKLVGETGLVYLGDVSLSEGPRFNRKQIAVARLRATDKFAAMSAADRQTAAKAAVGLIKGASKLTGRLQIHPPINDRVAWELESGVLSEN